MGFPRQTQVTAEPASQALQGVTPTTPCLGCGRHFVSTRQSQRHCRPSCRVTALRRRRQGDRAPEAQAPALVQAQAQTEVQVQYEQIGKVPATAPVPGTAPAPEAVTGTGAEAGEVQMQVQAQGQDTEGRRTCRT